MLFERDWLLRILKQLVELIVRALKLAGAKKYDEALEILQSAPGTLLGIEYRILAMIDAASAVDLLGNVHRATVFVKLVGAMADAEADRDLGAADRYRQHQRELLEVMVRKFPESEEARELLAAQMPTR